MIIVLVYQCMNRTHAYCILYRRFRPWCAHTYWIYRYTAYAEHAHAADACPYLFRLILKLNAWAYMHLYPYVTSLFPAAISHLTQRRPWPTQHGLGPQWKQSQRGMCWFIDLTEFIYSYLPDSGTIHVYEPGTRCLQPTFHFSSTSIKGQPFLGILFDPFWQYKLVWASVSQKMALPHMFECKSQKLLSRMYLVHSVFYLT